MNRLRQIAQVTGLCAAVLSISALTACANPIEQLVSQGTQGAVEELIKQQTGADVDLSTDGDGNISFETEDGSKIDIGGSSGLPAGWPDLPMPKGTVLTSVTPAEGNMMVSAKTTLQEAEKVIGDLKNIGYTETSTTEIGDTMSVILQGDDYRLMVGWLPDDDGVIFSYMVFPES